MNAPPQATESPLSRDARALQAWSFGSLFSCANSSQARALISILRLLARPKSWQLWLSSVNICLSTVSLSQMMGVAYQLSIKPVKRGMLVVGGGLSEVLQISHVHDMEASHTSSVYKRKCKRRSYVVVVVVCPTRSSDRPWPEAARMGVA